MFVLDLMYIAHTCMWIKRSLLDVERDIEVIFLKAHTYTHIFSIVWGVQVQTGRTSKTLL